MKSQINTLAHQCLFSSGPAVGLARAYLMRDSVSLVSYNWDNNCTAHARKAIRDKNDEKDFVTYDYKIHPTLIGEERRANIILQSEEQGWVELYDIYGVTIAKLTIKEGKNNFVLPTNISSSMILYKVFVNNKLKRTDKLILINR